MGWMLLSSSVALAEGIARSSDGQPIRWRGPEPYVSPSESYKEVWPGVGVGGVAGAVIGGPAGVVVGMVGGALLGHQVGTTQDLERTRNQVVGLEQALNDAEKTRIQSDENYKLLMNELASAKARLSQQFNQLANGFALNVSFRSESALIENRYEGQLLTLVGVLKKIPGLKIHVAAHTDARGSKIFNQKLAEYRAQSVADFFKSKGIEENRISYKAYGEDSAEYSVTDIEGNGFDRHVLITFCLKELS